jgi:hypothetical protein
VVPIPTTEAPAGVIPRNAPVVVAHLESPDVAAAAPLMQVPFTWKHFPVARFISPANVDVAVEVAEIYPARNMLPCTESAIPGLVVPMPTLPIELMLRMFAVLED